MRLYITRHSVDDMGHGNTRIGEVGGVINDRGFVDSAVGTQRP